MKIDKKYVLYFSVWLTAFFLIFTVYLIFNDIFSWTMGSYDYYDGNLEYYYVTVYTSKIDDFLLFLFILLTVNFAIIDILIGHKISVEKNLNMRDGKN